MKWCFVERKPTKLDAGSVNKQRVQLTVEVDVYARIHTHEYGISFACYNAKQNVPTGQPSCALGVLTSSVCS